MRFEDAHPFVAETYKAVMLGRELGYNVDVIRDFLFVMCAVDHGMNTEHKISKMFPAMRFTSRRMKIIVQRMVDDGYATKNRQYIELTIRGAQIIKRINASR